MRSHTVEFLWAVLVHFKALLGGGSLLVIVAGLAEHYSGRSVSWAAYTWIIAACFGAALIVHGVEQQKRLAARLRIRNVQRREYALPHGIAGVEYYFEVFNESESETLQGVKVQLVKMAPPAIDYLPVPLHIKHDNVVPHTTEFSVNPRESVNIDLITGPVSVYNSQASMVIAHTVVEARTTIPRRRYHLTVNATGANVPPVEAIFEAWVDDAGALECVQL